MGSGLVGGGGERRPRSNRDEAGHQLWGQGWDEPGAQGLWEQQELRKGSRRSGLGALGRGAGPAPALCSDPRAGRCGSHREDTPGPSLWFAGQQRGCLGKWGPGKVGAASLVTWCGSAVSRRNWPATRCLRPGWGPPWGLGLAGACDLSPFLGGVSYSS